MIQSHYKPDYKVNESLVAQAIDESFAQIYPGKDLSIYPDAQSIVNLIKSLAESCLVKKQLETVNVCKVNEGTFYEEIEDLKTIAERIKIIAFKNKDKSVTFYVHPRGIEPEDVVICAYKKCLDILRIDVRKNKVSYPRIAKVLVSYIEEDASNYKRRKMLYINEVDMLRKLFNKNCVVDLYHAFGEKVRKNDAQVLKVRMFEERYESDLHSYIDRIYKPDMPKLTDEDKKEIFIKCLKPLAELHKRKITHADIKPGNLLIDTKDKVNIAFCDLAFSRKLNHRFDQISLVGGTLAYYSIEDYIDVIKKESKFSSKRSLASDVWAMGVTLYEYLSGAERTFTDLFHPSIVLNSQVKEVKDVLARLHELEREKPMIETLSMPQKAQKYALVQAPRNWSPEPSPLVPSASDIATGVIRRSEEFDLTISRSRKRVSPEHLKFSQLAIIKERLNELQLILNILKPNKCVKMGALEQKGFIDSIIDISALVSEKICDHLLEEKLIGKEQKVIDNELYILAVEVCEKIIIFNQILIEKIIKCAQAWTSHADEDFFIDLVKRMMELNPPERLTAQNALKEVKRFSPS